MKDLKKYKVYLEVHHRKNNTITRYYESAKKFYAYTNGNINQDTISEYIAYLNQHYKKNSTVIHILGLNKLLDYLQLSHLRIPTPSFENTQRDTITKQEIQKILKHTREHYHLMDYLILLFITDLDCRPHEIAQSRWEWIRGDKIYFQDCKTGNTYGYLTDELKTHLELWKQQQPNNSYIFTNYQGSYKGQPITKQTQKIRGLIHRITKEIVGRVLNPQDIRASVITEEFNHYINPKTIQRKARHRSFKTTMKYNHVDDKELLEYLDTGTIFNNNIESIFKQKPQRHNDKGGYIKDLRTQDITEYMEEDNTSFSFSIYFLDQTPFFPNLWKNMECGIGTGCVLASPFYRFSISETISKVAPSFISPLMEVIP